MISRKSSEIWKGYREFLWDSAKLTESGKTTCTAAPRRQTMANGRGEKSTLLPVISTTLGSVARPLCLSDSLKLTQWPHSAGVIPSDSSLGGRVLSPCHHPVRQAICSTETQTASVPVLLIFFCAKNAVPVDGVLGGGEGRGEGKKDLREELRTL